MAAASAPSVVFSLVAGIALLMAAVPSAHALRCGGSIVERDSSTLSISSEAQWTTFKTNFAKGTPPLNGACDEVYGLLTITAWNSTTDTVLNSFPANIKKFTNGIKLVAHAVNGTQYQLSADFPQVDNTKFIEVLVRRDPAEVPSCVLDVYARVRFDDK